MSFVTKERLLICYTWIKVYKSSRKQKIWEKIPFKRKKVIKNEVLKIMFALKRVYLSFRQMAGCWKLFFRRLAGSRAHFFGKYFRQKAVAPYLLPPFPSSFTGKRKTIGGEDWSEKTGESFVCLKRQYSFDFCTQFRSLKLRVNPPPSGKIANIFRGGGGLRLNSPPFLCKKGRLVGGANLRLVCPASWKKIALSNFEAFNLFCSQPKLLEKHEWRLLRNFLSLYIFPNTICCRDYRSPSILDNPIHPSVEHTSPIWPSVAPNARFP